jgi:hypothetical protein
MHYATSTVNDTTLHRQESGKETGLCGQRARYDLDQQAASFGLATGALTVCTDCNYAAVTEGHAANGCQPLHVEHPGVLPAVELLRAAGYTPAVIFDEFAEGANGFYVEPDEEGGVTILQLVDGIAAEDEAWRPTVDAYEHALHVAGWRTSRERHWFLIDAQRLADPGAATVIPHQPDN